MFDIILLVGSGILFILAVLVILNMRETTKLKRELRLHVLANHTKTVKVVGSNDCQDCEVPDCANKRKPQKKVMNKLTIEEAEELIDLICGELCIKGVYGCGTLIKKTFLEKLKEAGKVETSALDKARQVVSLCKGGDLTIDYAARRVAEAYEEAIKELQESKS